MSPAVHTDHRALQITRKLLAWYSAPSDADALIERAIDAQLMKEEFSGAAHIDFKLLLKRTFRSETFARQQALLLEKWAPLIDANARDANISPQEAQYFLQDWVASIDHKLLFNHSLMVGYTRANRAEPSSDYTTAYHANREAWTLHLTLAGAVQYCSGVNIDAVRGDMLLIAPDASCHYQRAANEPQWSHYWALFQPDPRWIEFMQWPICTHGIYKLSLDSEANRQLMEQLFVQLMEMGGATTPLQEHLTKNIFEQILIRAQNTVASNPLGTTDPRVIRASNYLLDHLAELTPLAQIAAACNLSESRLSHLFQQHLKMGVHKYRNCLRLQQAKKLLATTAEPIALIAQQVGYDDPAQFSKFFARSIGCSPRDFRIKFSATAIEPVNS